MEYFISYRKPALDSEIIAQGNLIANTIKVLMYSCVWYILKN